MRRLTAAGDRFGQARDLGSVLDAACEAFEEILAVIGDYEDASDALVVPLLLAATQAANGRDAVLFAPSLPARRLDQLRVGEEPERGSAQDVIAAVSGLCQLLASGLARTAAADVTDVADRAACYDAARHAQQIHALLTGGGP
jgi:hypothetical protein